MSDNTFYGISFPFRIGVRGGVVMSTTTIDNPAHIIEAITQILLTAPMERGMEYHFKCDVDTDIFDPNDISTHTLIDYQVREALRVLEDRIEINSINISSEDTKVNAEINFTVILTGHSYSHTFALGGAE